MKRNLILWTTVFLLIFSCKQKSQELQKDKSTRTKIVESELPRGNNVDDSFIENIPKFTFSDTSFRAFYNKFISDSLFQIRRVKFPLVGNYQSYDDERNWNEKEWPIIKWDFRVEMNNPDDSVSIVQNHNIFFYGTYCKECGFSLEIQFEKFEDEWFLTYRQENNF